MTYFKLSLLCYMVLTNCFFYAYSSQNKFLYNNTQKTDKKASNVVTNDVPIDIYVLLDDNKIPKEESQVKEFLYNVGKYDQNHEEDAFGKTLIPCTTGDQKITLSFKSENGKFTFYPYNGKVIENMKKGIKNIIKNMKKGNKNIINDNIGITDSCSYSKKKLYDSLLELSNDKFNENYENFLIYYIDEKDEHYYFQSDIILKEYKKNNAFRFSYVYPNVNADCLANISRVKIFFNYKKGFKAFCDHFLDNCFNDFSAQIDEFKKQLTKLNSVFDEQKKKLNEGDIVCISGKLENMKNVVNGLLFSISKDMMVWTPKKEVNVEKSNKFEELFSYIDELSETYNEKLQSIKEGLEEVSNKISKMHEEKNKEEKKEKVIIINDNNNNASNANNMQEQKKKVNIDIYFSLDDSKIPYSKKTSDKFLDNLKKYEQNSEEDAFGGTLIKCTTEDQEINLSFKPKDGKYYIYFSGDEIINSMKVGIEKIINDNIGITASCSYSKKKLYDSLLELLNDNFNKNYENCLITYIGENPVISFHYPVVSKVTYGVNKPFNIIYYNSGECKKDFNCINRVKIFFSYRGEFEDFCKYFLENCFVDVCIEIEALEEQIKELNSDLEERIAKLENVNSKNYIFEYLKKIDNNLITFFNEIFVSINEEAEKFSQVNNGINFVEFDKYIEEQNKTYNEKLQSIKKTIAKVRNQIQNNYYNFLQIKAEIETDETTTEGLDSTQNIKFIQIPKKTVLNSSKLGLRKVCSCKCRSRN